MTETVATMEFKGIKCDNVECDYKDMGVEFDPEKYLNMPCPKCGESLFTPEDCKTIQVMMDTMKTLNDIFSVGDFPDNEKVSIGVELDGSGSIKFGNVEKVE